jgi:hypothetical protein
MMEAGEVFLLDGLGYFSPSPRIQQIWRFLASLTSETVKGRTEGNFLKNTGQQKPASAALTFLVLDQNEFSPIRLIFEETDILNNTLSFKDNRVNGFPTCSRFSHQN